MNSLHVGLRKCALKNIICPPNTRSVFVPVKQITKSIFSSKIDLFAESLWGAERNKVGRTVQHPEVWKNDNTWRIVLLEQAPALTNVFVIGHILKLKQTRPVIVTYGATIALDLEPSIAFHFEIRKVSAGVQLEAFRLVLPPAAERIKEHSPPRLQSAAESVALVTRLYRLDVGHAVSCD